MEYLYGIWYSCNTGSNKEGNVQMKHKHIFKPRVPELLKLEGWYEEGGLRIKISCRYKDILRCSQFSEGGKRKQHFKSCFSPTGIYRQEPLLRLTIRDNWAIVYLPDKHGNFMGRCFISYQNGLYTVYKMYGNKLTQEHVIRILEKMNMRCEATWSDVYIIG